jgi:hypothetical protein
MQPEMVTLDRPASSKVGSQPSVSRPRELVRHGRRGISAGDNERGDSAASAVMLTAEVPRGVTRGDAAAIERTRPEA